MVQKAEDRPPYVVFETRAVEDRNASIEQGHFVAVDIDYAIITPMGSKDKIERIAGEWLDHLTLETESGRFPKEWLRAFKGAYADWKEGREAPVNGTSILHWPIASPAQIKMLQNWGIRTVEDLSMANEETISRLGMGGRALKQQAVEWLAESADRGKVVSEISALKAANSDLRNDNAALLKRLEALEAVAASKVPAKAA